MQLAGTLHHMIYSTLRGSSQMWKMCHTWYAGHRSAHACILSSCLTHLLIQLFRGCLEDWLCAFSFGIACTSYSRSPGPAMRECWSALKTPSCMYVCICQSENGYGSELCIVLLVGQSSRGSLVTRTSWAACPDISSALASGEFLVLLLIACKLVGGMLADISTQVLHLDGSEKALAMTLWPELRQDAKVPLPPFRL